MDLDEYINKIYEKNEFKCNVFGCGYDLIYTFKINDYDKHTFDDLHFFLSNKNLPHQEIYSLFQFHKLLVFEIHKYFIDTIWVDDEYFGLLWDKMSVEVNNKYRNDIIKVLGSEQFYNFEDIIWDIIPNYENLYKTISEFYGTKKTISEFYGTKRNKLCITKVIFSKIDGNIDFKKIYLEKPKLKKVIETIVPK